MIPADPGTSGEHGLDLLRQGSEEIDRSRELLADSRSEAEKTARSALKTLRSATNWLEDTEHFDDAHRALDAAGRFVRDEFGCILTRSGTQYFQDCPVALAHNRIGMSVGGAAREVECSICGCDPEDCEHVTGQVYDGVRCLRVITRMDIFEISLVDRPAHPDARIERISIEHGELRDVLREVWKPGMDVSCDRCLMECDGVYWPDLSAHGKAGGVAPAE